MYFLNAKVLASIPLRLQAMISLVVRAQRACLGHRYIRLKSVCSDDWSSNHIYIRPQQPSTFHFNFHLPHLTQSPQQGIDIHHLSIEQEHLQPAVMREERQSMSRPPSYNTEPLTRQDQEHGALTKEEFGMPAPKPAHVRRNSRYEQFQVISGPEVQRDDDLEANYRAAARYRSRPRSQDGRDAHQQLRHDTMKTILIGLSIVVVTFIAEAVCPNLEKKWPHNSSLAGFMLSIIFVFMGWVMPVRASAASWSHWKLFLIFGPLSILSMTVLAIVEGNVEGGTLTTWPLGNAIGIAHLLLAALIVPLAKNLEPRMS